ncbi:MAG: sulfate ABC transporter permease subunit CysW [Spirochaetia bacterium]|nr:sulfate ABC transporter permease subunit CysW [Spirochaetia bacterium]
MQKSRITLNDPLYVRIGLIAVVLLFFLFFLILPLGTVFYEAFSQGIGVYFESLVEPAALAAIRLTFLVAGIAVPLNTAFGLAAAWVMKFSFKGKNVLISFMDLPFSVSPVISGLIYVLMFGLQGWFGTWLQDNNIKIIFALPGLVLATVFVTFPFVAREVIALVEAQGNEEELAALSLGASGFSIFWRVTIPNIKWALLYGVIQCNARAMGEFGAVSVVSGHIRGQTNTIPLHVEILFNEYNFTASFAVASVLAFLGVITLILKTVFERKAAAERRRASGAIA